MLGRIRHMLVKEFIQTFRDPRMRGVIFVAPIFQLIIFGYAVNTDVRHVATAVYDLDNSVESRELVGRMTNSGYFDVAEHVYDDERAQELVDRGAVRALLRMNRGFGSDLRSGRTAQVQLVLDGTDSNTASIVLTYMAGIASEYSRQVLVERLERSGGAAKLPGGVTLKSRAWFNENLISRNFFVPGVIAILVTLITLMLTSMAIVREKELGTMEQILVTPITSTEFILGKTVPFALVGFADVLMITAVGVFWFEVPIRGSLLLLLGATAVYLMTSLGIGLLISTLSRTQQQAIMTTFLFLFPAILLSGFVFPIENMPRVIQWLTYANPLRYFLVIIRGIFQKGVGMGVLWPQFAALGVLGVLTLKLATSRFRKTLA